MERPSQTLNDQVHEHIRIISCLIIISNFAIALLNPSPTHDRFLILLGAANAEKLQKQLLIPFVLLISPIRWYTIYRILQHIAAPDAIQIYSGTIFIAKTNTQIQDVELTNNCKFDRDIWTCRRRGGELVFTANTSTFVVIGCAGFQRTYDHMVHRP
jgi:hypothetical protein